MKNKIFDFLQLVLTIISIGIAGYFLYENEKLNTLVGNQNTFIKDVTGKESEFLKDSKKYRDSIVSYQNETTYLTEGKELTSKQFIERFDKMRVERDSLKSLYDYAKKVYRFDVTLKSTKDSITLSTSGKSRADSARIALKYFKHRIKRHNLDWTITVDPPEEKPVKNTTLKRDLEKPTSDTSKLK